MSYFVVTCWGIGNGYRVDVFFFKNKHDSHQKSRCTCCPWFFIRTVITVVTLSLSLHSLLFTLVVGTHCALGVKIPGSLPSHFTLSSDHLSEQGTFVFLIGSIFLKVWELLFLKLKILNGRIKIEKWKTHKEKTKVLYYKQKMKIENNWKKWKVSSTIKFKKLKNISKISKILMGADG